MPGIESALMRVMFASVLLTVALLAGTVTALGQTAPDCSTVSYDGEGTLTNPYEVSNVKQLQCIGEQDLDDYYRLVSNINASETSEWHGGEGFRPIGEDSRTQRFDGDFEGGGYSITQLTVNRPDEQDVGLFGVIEDGAVENVTLEEAHISGRADAGVLVGHMEDGTLKGAHATGDIAGNWNVGGLIGRMDEVTVSGSSADADVNGTLRVGGLVGTNRRNTGMIEESHAGGTITSSEGSAGGLVGGNHGTVRESYATGTVTDNSKIIGAAGGLIGSNRGPVAKSYATGDVSGREEVGGLAGVNSDIVTESYATGDVTGSERVGGFAGKNDGGIVRYSNSTGDVDGDEEVGGFVGNNFNGTVTKSYARGDVNGFGNVGALVGVNMDTLERSYATGKVNGANKAGGLVGSSDGGTVTNSYWDRETTGQSSSDGGTGLATNEMTGSDASKNMRGFDFTDTWVMTSDYPVFGDVAEPDCSKVEYNGDGTEANPYEVDDVDQLQCIKKQSLTANYVQVSDIDASSTSEWNIDKGFDPIGGLGHERYESEESFDGTFDGNGYNIMGLVIHRVPVNLDLGRDEPPTGMFGVSGSNATLVNVTLTDANITGSRYAGVLVGENDGGMITGSRATGQVVADLEVGGLMGINVDGMVRGSVAEVEVNASDPGQTVGGLVGSVVGGTVTDSHATGNVSSHDEDIGGLVGYVGRGKVTDSYATGNVSAERKAGGLIGNIKSGTVNNSYATGDVEASFRRAGGLVGVNGEIFDPGKIVNSYATGNVTGDNTVGGLVGVNAVRSRVKNSHSTGNVDGSVIVGGLVGRNIGGTVDRSYSESDVNATRVIGGIVGRNSGFVDDLVGRVAGAVRKSYSSGSVNGTSAVGGAVGINNEEGTVSESYSVAKVSGTDFVGGLVGASRGTVAESYAAGEVTGTSNVSGLIAFTENGNVTGAYWDTEATGQRSSEGGTGLTTSEMTGEEAPENMEGFNFTDTWVVTDEYPRLAWQSETGKDGNERLPGFTVTKVILTFLAVLVVARRRVE